MSARARADGSATAVAVALLLACLAVGGPACVRRTEPGAGGDIPDDPELQALAALPYVSRGEVDSDASGVTVRRPEAWPGINLFTDDERTALAVDMDGEVVHRWRIPDRFRHCEHFELMGDGGIVAVCVHQAVVRLDRDSRLLWSVDIPAHHDVAVLEDGEIVVPVIDDPVEHAGYRVRFDSLARIAASGDDVEIVWSAQERLDELRRHHPPSPLDTAAVEDRERTYDYYHLNTVEVLPPTPLGQADPRFRAGNLLLCLRNASLLVVLDAATLEVVWSWGPGELSYPHAPELLPTGTLLVFDNGVERDHSRIVEMRPEQERIVWTYVGSPPQSFYSRWRGSAQRLPGGTTLICDAESGRLLEVSRDGEIVWEYWNPDIVAGRRKRIYRARRLSVERFRDLVPVELRGGP